MGCASRSKFGVVILCLQTLFLILFGVFADYRYDVKVQSRWFYPMFQNVHVMMFIGFGFLMTFLKRYGYSAVSVNFLIAAMVIQWHMIFKGLLHHGGSQMISIGLVDLISADFTSAAVLISFGAVIGKTSPLQLIIMAFIEVVVFTVNEYLAVEVFRAADVGGSMVVHIFGAYFGLAVSRVITRDYHSESPNESSSYVSDIFSMCGTVFLWLYWPSFNSAVAGSESQQMRAIINTYLALASCAVVTFAFSSITDRKGKFDMVHIQNATLAGGVAVGTAANFMIQPWGACLIGILASVLSVVGFSYIQPALQNKLGLHDSCGVNNLHGMPGILAAVIGAIGVALIDVNTYENDLENLFPAMVGTVNGTTARTAGEQAGYQAATMGATIGIALVGGALTGLFLRFVPGLDEPQKLQVFNDDQFFKVGDDFGAMYKEVRNSALITSEEAQNGESSQSKM